MPQGSRISPNAFPPYTSPLFGITERHGAEVHMYADDTQLFIPFSVEKYDSAIAKLEACSSEIKTWLDANHLKQNDAKTRFLVVGQKQLLNRIERDKSIVIGSSMIHTSQCAQNIGNMTLTRQLM